jgi:signal transduction histidine kinase
MSGGIRFRLVAFVLAMGLMVSLIQNAADSIGRNGAITPRVRVETKRLSDRTTEVVILEVADTGEGIPPEVEKRLFDPFFTTKESGTGLGVAIAARIIEKHGGALQYQTQMNRGTVFGIVLPRARYGRARQNSDHRRRSGDRRDAAAGPR